jgi:hypothetical protein
MYVQFNVDKYSVVLSNFKLPYAYIMLYDANNKWRARINFAPLPDVNSPTEVNVGTDVIDTYMNINLLDEAIDLLRNEKPITATINSDYNIFLLGTGKEPVGEEETRRFTLVGPYPLPAPPLGS